jgi:hypothetical protein
MTDLIRAALERLMGLRQYTGARAVLAHPAPPAEADVTHEELPPRVGHILRLAEIIRGVDGNHDKGAAALAEAILSHPDICSTGLAAPEPPAEGELVEELRGLADYFSGEGYSATWINLLTDAADLLAQRHPAPVPVSERLPGNALCWWYEPDEDDDGSGYGGSWTLLRICGAVSCYTHWLPATALPLPTTEATND